MTRKNFFLNRTKKLLPVGYFISFTGSLPPGIITLGILQAGFIGGISAAVCLSLGAVLVEVLVVWLILKSTAWLLTRKKWLKGLEWVSLVIVVLLALGAGWVVMHPKNTELTTQILPQGIPYFSMGMLLRLITPTFIPFWLGWSMVLFSRDLLPPQSKSHYVYLTSIALGTFSAHLLFILFSSLAENRINDIQLGINWLIFILLSVTALAQIAKLSGFQFKKNGSKYSSTLR